MPDDEPQIAGGCRYIAASGCLLGLGAVLAVILVVIAALTFFSAGVYSLASYLWSLV
jgi:hypothetical protein